MPTATGSRRLTLLGVTAVEEVTLTAPESVIADPTLAVAKIGALTTRTDDDTGELTMNASHGIQTGDRLDVYWSGGSRLGMTVGTVATNQVPIDGGTGDVLPADETAVTAMVPTLYDFNAELADLVAVVVNCPVPAGAVFRSAVPADVKVVQITSDADYIWSNDTAEANPFGANVTHVYLSHGNSASARQVNAVALLD